MTKIAVSIPAVFLATFVFLSVEVMGQQRIASIQSFIGEVEVEHSAQIIKPLKIGRMVRSGDVFDADTVRTRKGEADLLVVDGSVVKMDQDTALYMAFKTAQAAAGVPAPGTPDRRIKLVGGRIWCDVKPSRIATTQFELPDGVAAVRGTIVEFAVDPAKGWNVGVDRGLMTLNHTGIRAQVSLTSGNKLGVRKMEKGE